jgi:hypothetical protein
MSCKHIHKFCGGTVFGAVCDIKLKITKFINYSELIELHVSFLRKYRPMYRQ